MALQTREQHIRRDKATSNICTAQVLLAVIAGMYAVYHGPEGLRRIGRRVHDLTRALAQGLRQHGLDVVHDNFFDTVARRPATRTPPKLPWQPRRPGGSTCRSITPTRIGIALDETTTSSDVADLLAIFGARRVDGVPSFAAEAPAPSPASSQRTSARTSTHPVFHRYRSETEMLRYLKRLEYTRPLAHRGDDPAGLLHHEAQRHHGDDPGHLAGVRRLHPFAPAIRAEGYTDLFDASSRSSRRSPASTPCPCSRTQGSQGEFAGLLCHPRVPRARAATTATSA